MTLPEECVLQSQYPIPEDLNDWPDFTLTHAKVCVSGTANHANLLEARTDNPLSVTGRLSYLDNQRAKLGIQSVSQSSVLSLMAVRVQSYIQNTPKSSSRSKTAPNTHLDKTHPGSL